MSSALGARHRLRPGGLDETRIVEDPEMAVLADGPQVLAQALGVVLRRHLGGAGLEPGRQRRDQAAGDVREDIVRAQLGRQGLQNIAALLGIQGRPGRAGQRRAAEQRGADEGREGAGISVVGMHEGFSRV